MSLLAPSPLVSEGAGSSPEQDYAHLHKISSRATQSNMDG